MFQPDRDGVHQATTLLTRHERIPTDGAGPDRAGLRLHAKRGIQRVHDQGVGWLVETRGYIDQGQLPARCHPATERLELAALLEHPLGQSENRQDQLVEISADLRLHRPSGSQAGQVVWLGASVSPPLGHRSEMAGP
jgi:hypothetical protein